MPLEYPVGMENAREDCTSRRFARELSLWRALTARVVTSTSLLVALAPLRSMSSSGRMREMALVMSVVLMARRLMGSAERVELAVGLAVPSVACAEAVLSSAVGVAAGGRVTPAA
ncbi:Uncharacterised protein [Mycobacterium tuberculosis]|nr:Uncharacterised protein [Mycobacterium tuberculosis]